MTFSQNQQLSSIGEGVKKKLVKIGKEVKKLQTLTSKVRFLIKKKRVEYDFLRGPQEQLPYQKLGRLIVAFGSYRSKTIKLALNGQNFAIPWPKIRHIRIFPAL